MTKVQVLGFVNGNTMYRKLCLGDTHAEVWSEVADALSEASQYFWDEERLPHMRTLEFRVKEVPDTTEEEDQEKWMEMPR